MPGEAPATTTTKEPSMTTTTTETEPTVRDFWQEGPHALSATLDTTITPEADSPVSMTWRAVLTEDAVNSSGEPVTYRVAFYRTYHAAGTNVPEVDAPWHLAGEPRTGWTTEDAAMTWAEKEDHADAWDFDNDLLYRSAVELAVEVKRSLSARADRVAIDKIATLLGTAVTWDGAADFLDDIANIIGRVRPSVGSEPDQYAAAFLATTGHAVDAEFDQRDR